MRIRNSQLICHALPLLLTSFDAGLTQSVPPHDAGKLSGAVDGMGSMCRIAAPLIAGVCMEYGFNAAPFVLGGALSALGAITLAVVVPRVAPTGQGGAKAKAA